MLIPMKSLSRIEQIFRDSNVKKGSEGVSEAKTMENSEEHEGTTDSRPDNRKYIPSLWLILSALELIFFLSRNSLHAPSNYCRHWLPHLNWSRWLVGWELKNLGSSSYPNCSGRDWRTQGDFVQISKSKGVASSICHQGFSSTCHRFTCIPCWRKEIAVPRFVVRCLLQPVLFPEQGLRKGIQVVIVVLKAWQKPYLSNRLQFQLRKNEVWGECNSCDWAVLTFLCSKSLLVISIVPKAARESKTTCLFKLCQEVMHAVGKLKSCEAQPRKGYQRLAGCWAVQVISPGNVHWVLRSTE